MDELKAYLKDGFSEETQKKTTRKKDTSATDKKNAELAKLYEDAAEYEAELKGFEAELEVINANELKDLATALAQELPNEDRDYAQELKAILIATWTHLVEINTHPVAHLELIKETDFCDVVESLCTTYPEYDGDFEAEIRNTLVKRWEALIAIKKEHIKEEETDLKIAGLKPSFVKRIYKQVNGIK